MKFKIVILLLFCRGFLFGQDQGIEIHDSLGGGFIYKVAKDRIVKKLKAFEKYSLEDLTPTSKWIYHRAVSSCKLYLGKDSSLYHFREAYKIRPKSTCNSMRARHDYFISAIEEEQASGKEDAYMRQIKKETGDSIFSWYLWDLPNFDEFAFIDSCNQKFPIEKAKPIVKDSTLVSEIIRRRDQKYRTYGNFEDQHELDKMNRDFIDSLYVLKKSLSAFNEDEIYQFSMVTHHSDDCDWNYKWMERLIDHYESGYEGQSLLGPLLQRMLKTKDGFCTEQDAQKRDQFVNKIKEKYPEFVEKKKLNW